MQTLRRIGSSADSIKGHSRIQPLPQTHSPKCLYADDASSSTYAQWDSQSSTSSRTKSFVSLSKSPPKSQRMSYKQRMPLCCRKSESALLLQRHPDKIALIVERYRKERRLRDVDRCQFLVPKTATVGQLQHILRERFCDGNMTIFLLVNDELPAATTTLETLSHRHRDEDGFLYVNVSTEEFLG